MQQLVRTVGGDLPPQGLGFCDCHAHTMIVSEYMTGKMDMFDQSDYEKSRLEMLDFHRAGGRLMVDCQPVGAGRATQFLRPLSADTGVHVVASTGFHAEFFYPADHWCLTAGEDALTRLFVEELEQGMYYDGETRFPTRRCQTRAGIIKCASAGPKLTPRDMRRMRAAANACLVTGAPIICHTENGSGIAHCQCLLGLGVPAHRIILAHLDREPLPLKEYLMPIAAMGVFLELDAIGTDIRSEGEEVRLILAMAEQGALDNAMLGLDPTRDKMLHYGGQYGFAYLPGAFCQALLAAGLSQEDLDRITRHNPARALAFSKRAI